MQYGHLERAVLLGLPLVDTHSAVTLCTLIVLSTLTTGWHYFIDAMAGILLAVFAIWTAHKVALLFPADRQTANL